MRRLRHRRTPAPAAGTRPPLAAHAVVVGAGLGGLAAAQALSRHVERVTVIERDDLPERPVPRAGVPPSRHVHVLQPGGLAALERLVPGVAADLVAAGAVPLRIPTDLLWLAPAGWVPRFPALDRHVLLSASRELLEWGVRRRVFESPQVLVRSGLDVRGLVVEHGRVRGVEVRSRRAGSDGPTVAIDADLVVDAGGRRSPAARWLVAAGLAPPVETEVDSGLAYASRLYRRSAGDTPGWRAAIVGSRPSHEPRGAILAPLEGNRWMLTVSSVGGDVPPTDEDGFGAFVRSLRGPDIGEFVSRAEPLGPIAAFRRTDNRRRHYEHLARPLDGFVAVGDALCALNPLYGQGMGVAALAAEALDTAVADHLADHRTMDGVGAAAQRAVARPAAAAWDMATGLDLRYPGVRGDGRSRARRGVDAVMGRYLRRVGAAATTDPRVNAAQVDVIGQLAPSPSLLRPAVAVRALRPGRRTPSAKPQWSAGPATTPAPAARWDAAEAG